MNVFKRFKLFAIHYSFDTLMPVGIPLLGKGKIQALREKFQLRNKTFEQERGMDLQGGREVQTGQYATVLKF